MTIRATPIAPYHRNAVVAAVATALKECSAAEFKTIDSAIITAGDYELKLLTKCPTAETLFERTNAKLKVIYSVYPTAAYHFEPLGVATLRYPANSADLVGFPVLRRVLEMNAAGKQWVLGNREPLLRILRNKEELGRNVTADGVQFDFLMQVLERVIVADEPLSGEVRLLQHNLQRYISAREAGAVASSDSAAVASSAIAAAPARSAPMPTPPEPEAPSINDAIRYCHDFLYSTERLKAMRDHVIERGNPDGDFAREIRGELILLDKYYTATLAMLHSGMVQARVGASQHPLSLSPAIIGSCYYRTMIAIRKLSGIAAFFGLTPNTFADNAFLFNASTVVSTSRVSAFASLQINDLKTRTAARASSAAMNNSNRVRAFDGFIVTLAQNLRMLEHCAGVPPTLDESGQVDVLKLLPSTLMTAPVCKTCTTPHRYFVPSGDEIQQFHVSGAVPSELRSEFQRFLRSDALKSVVLTNLIVERIPLVESLRVFVTFNSGETEGNISMFCNEEFAVLIDFVGSEPIDVQCLQKCHTIACPRWIVDSPSSAQTAGGISSGGATAAGAVDGSAATMIVDAYTAPDCEYKLDAEMTHILRHYVRSSCGGGRMSPSDVAIAVYDFWWKQCIYLQNELSGAM